ncbi:MAG: 50S ribosomal protein L29 [Vampirovibrionales bacterium]|nr:50S ribosomal protein L29 [Vampirovibrionales bacterium]
MANKSFQALNEQTSEALEREVYDIKKQLFEMRLKKASRQIEDSSQFRKLRHKIAQILTVLSARQKQVS